MALTDNHGPAALGTVGAPRLVTATFAEMALEALARLAALGGNQGAFAEPGRAAVSARARGWQQARGAARLGPAPGLPRAPGPACERCVRAVENPTARD